MWANVSGDWMLEDHTPSESILSALAFWLFLYLSIFTKVM